MKSLNFPINKPIKISFSSYWLVVSKKKKKIIECCNTSKELYCLIRTDPYTLSWRVIVLALPFVVENAFLMNLLFLRVI